jgi:hypothetical protein
MALLCMWTEGAGGVINKVIFTVWYYSPFPIHTFPVFDSKFLERERDKRQLLVRDAGPSHQYGMKSYPPSRFKVWPRDESKGLGGLWSICLFFVYSVFPSAFWGREGEMDLWKWKLYFSPYAHAHTHKKKVCEEARSQEAWIWEEKSTIMGKNRGPACHHSVMSRSLSPPPTPENPRFC